MENYEKGEITKLEMQTSRFIRLFGELGIECNASDFRSCIHRENML